jgi:hypothetical protein
MPQIIVTAGPAGKQDEGAVMLRERVTAADFESERFAANLVERLGWAVLDATEKEGYEAALVPAESRALAAKEGREADRVPAESRAEAASASPRQSARKTLTTA